MKNQDLDSWLEYLDSFKIFKTEILQDKLRSLYKKIIKLSPSTKVIIVGGTNGKGSTVEFLTQLLVLNNKRVGTFTSPHLFSFNERIRVNGNPVSDQTIINAFELIEKKRSNLGLTYFDFSTLAALYIFSELNLDAVVLEIGLGGRLDPVNLVDPDVSVLTNVELDHQELLGNSREEIGKEKSAIFRNKKIVILGQHDLPESVLEETKKLKNKVFKIGKDFDYLVNDSFKEWSYVLEIENKKKLINNLPLRNLSVSSLSCALTAFYSLGLKSSVEIEKVLSKTHLKGRCEQIDNRFLFDVSHNASSAKFLASYLKRNFKKDIKISAVLGVMKDKDAHSIIKPFCSSVSSWFLTAPDTKRAMKTRELRKYVLANYSSMNSVSVQELDRIEEACIKAHQETPKDGLILVFGSFNTVVEAFSAINPIKSVA